MPADDIFETEVSRVNKEIQDRTHPMLDELIGDWSGEQLQDLLIDALQPMPDGALSYIMEKLMLEAIIRGHPELIVDAVIKAAHSHSFVEKEQENRRTRADFKRDLDQIQDL
jgi:hypothetical protein